MGKKMPGSRNLGLVSKAQQVSDPSPNYHFSTAKAGGWREEKERDGGEKGRERGRVRYRQRGERRA
jgi:hypothetical protein